MSNLVPVHKSLESSLVDVPLLSKEVDDSDVFEVYEESAMSTRSVILIIITVSLVVLLYLNFAFDKSDS
ncbi:hypothetical protein CRE_24686 [Caenorhabditis remanei]|uniref:Uncharacterized protein n=1 Tax=Caenorhabditis remanei TaxID=31234 RepID=E3N3T8_CAERE|nr:hypothetical protein CRE_24686 [Caenorhabditis remanei]